MLASRREARMTIASPSTPAGIATSMEDCCGPPAPNRKFSDSGVH